MEEATALRGVVTPRPMLPDEISAVVFLERFHGNPVTEIKFLEHSECTREQLDEFMKQGWFPIEIGEMSYKKVKNSKNEPVGSATEAVVVNLGLDSADLPSGEVKLIELMALRNKDGRLNQGYMSIPRIFGNLYDFGYDEMDLIERFKDVVYAFRDDKNRKADGIPPAREDAPIEEELPDLIQATNKKEWKKLQFASFTPSRYLRDLWRLGAPVDEIREKVSFWIGAWERFQEEYRKAKELWESGSVEKIAFSVNGFSGAAVETNNRFIAKVATPTVDIFINRRTDGHGAIMTRSRDVSALGQELERLEPRRWYYHQPAGHLINGAQSPASELTLDHLVEAVKTFPPSN